MDRDLNCEICNNPFDIDNRSPICIPCGHTLCLMCLKENYEKEGKIKCANDNKAFNLRPEQYARNHYILKLLQSKKTVITNININKNFNLVNNNKISLNSTNCSSNRSERVNTITFLKDENKINKFNHKNNLENNNNNNNNINDVDSFRKANNLNFDRRSKESNKEVKIFAKSKLADIPINNSKAVMKNNYLIKTQSILNKQEKANEQVKNIFEQSDSKQSNLHLDSSRSVTYRNSLQEKQISEITNADKELFKEPSNTFRNFSNSKQIIVKKIKIIDKKNSSAFENDKLLIFNNTRFEINSNFIKNNYGTNVPFNCKNCGCYNNEINFNCKNNYVFSENNNTSFAYSEELNKIENKEIKQELNTLNNLLNKNFCQDALNNKKTNKDQLESFFITQDVEESSITINDADIISIDPNNYSSNVFFDNINLPIEKTNIFKLNDEKKISQISSSKRIMLKECPNIEKTEKSKLTKINKITKITKLNKKQTNELIDDNIKTDINSKNIKIEYLNFNKEANKNLHFHSNDIDEKNNLNLNKLFPTITAKEEQRLYTHGNSDSKQFNSSYLSNENFNFNLIESATNKEIKLFESRIKNNDSASIIFGYVNILKNFFAKVNEINVLKLYPKFDFLYAEIITAINLFLKFSVILLLILFNVFLFKCDFFLRFNMYLILINDTKSVIEKGETGLIVANIKRWFAFISVVILDELIKFLYLPYLVLNAWTCLMTIYLLLISGPESGVQFIIVSIYKFLRKLNLFY